MLVSKYFELMSTNASHIDNYDTFPLPVFSYIRICSEWNGLYSARTSKHHFQYIDH